MDKIDFNAPAFGSNASVPPTEVPQTEQEEELEGEEGTGSSSPAEVVEQQVPYSRFSTALQRAKEAEREAREAQIRYEELQNSRPAIQENNREAESYRGQLPNYWIKLYGDSEASREAYGVESERQRQFEEAVERKAEQRALSAVREEREFETRALAENEETIDDNLDELAAILGRDLTEKEALAVLDIVDEYTPTDSRTGKYIGEPISFAKAHEIYELRQERRGASNKEARRTVTSLTGGKSEGEPTDKAKSDENWNPLDWSFMKKYQK